MIYVRLLLGLMLSSIISYTGYRKQALTAGGMTSAVVVGTLIVGFGGWAWGSLLAAFFVSSSLLSYYRRADKSAVSDEFAKSSRRDWGQVLANGALGALLAVSYRLLPRLILFAAFVGAIAAVGSDTWATEIGVLSRRPPRHFTTGRVVSTGTSGGVSRAGSLAALAGALFIGLCAILFAWAAGLITGQPVALETLWPVLPIAGVSGLIGTFFDSLLGATVQHIYYCRLCDKETEQAIHHCGSPSQPLRGWRWLDNDLVNFISSGVGALLAAGLWIFIVGQ